jgi:hypothetical protein
MASEVFFTTNPADYEQLEGLYITEKRPPGIVQGRALNTVGMAGRCVRGPLTPQLITSPARFTEVYGGRDYGGGGAVVGEVWKALVNKKFGPVVVRRVAADDAVVATKNVATVTPTTIARVDATSVGLWGNDVTIKVEDATDGVATHWNLRVNYRGAEVVYENLDTTTGNDNLASVIGDDLGNPVVVTKVADGRPINTTPSPVNLASGSEGTLTATHYVNGITDVAYFQGVAVCLVPEVGVTQATLNAAIVTLAAAIRDRIFLVWSGSTSNAPATEATAKSTQITTQSDRIWWCFNASRTNDPGTGTLFWQGPHVWMASILSQTDVDIHPGAHENAEFCAGINSLQNEALTRDDLILLRKAGISTLEKLPGEFLFRSAVTTNTDPALAQCTRRRMVDFLQLSGSDALKFNVKGKNTRIRRAQEAGELIAFSAELQGAERIIDADSDDNGPGFLVDNVSVNTTSQRGRGIEKLLWRVRLIGHQLYLVLETEMATGLIIEQAAA